MDKIWDVLAYGRRDIASCETEPIQNCGAIQNFGWLVGVSKADLQIVAASANCCDILPPPVSRLFGIPIQKVLAFRDETPFALEPALAHSQAGAFPVKLVETGRVLNASVFDANEFWCIDLEPIWTGPTINPHEFVERLRTLVFQVDLEESLEPMLERAVAQIRALTDFERVMIYRFEPNGDGCVAAESRVESVESFLGLHYPASDIPAQARKLYLESRYRMIVDVDSMPVPVETRPGLARTALDIGCSALRAVSPFHVQYLKNMGVTASFSVPLRVNDSLWGLIACHQYAGPKFIPRELRSSCELAGHVISRRIADQISVRRQKIRYDIRQLSQAVLNSVTAGKTAIESFREHADAIMQATESSGLFLRLGGETVSSGETPKASYIEEIIGKLSSQTGVTLWKSDCISADFGLRPDAKAAGALAIPLAFGFSDLIIWFRPEFTREVKWGGKPGERGDKSDVLSPRHSFAAWVEKLTGRSRPWSEGAQEAAQNILFAFVQGIFKKSSDLAAANAELARATKAKDDFIAMVSHELRAPLGVMIGWIDLLREDFEDSLEFRRAFEIIDRNAKLQFNLVNDLLDISRMISGKMRIAPTPCVAVHELIKDVISDLQPAAKAKPVHLEIRSLAPTMAEVDRDRLRQIVWNLVSNAIKFTPNEGRIAVTLENQGRSYSVAVSDTGLGIEKEQLCRIFDRFVQVQEGAARSGGLGLGLSIVKSLVGLHGGQIQAESPGKDKGSTFTVSLPVSLAKGLGELNVF